MRTGTARFALAFLAASTASVLAQDTTGTITGRSWMGRIYRVTQAGLNPARETNQQYTTLFVQDTWKHSV